MLASVMRTSSHYFKSLFCLVSLRLHCSSGYCITSIGCSSTRQQCPHLCMLRVYLVQSVPCSRGRRHSFYKGLHEDVRPTLWWFFWCSFSIPRNPTVHCGRLARAGEMQYVVGTPNFWRLGGACISGYPFGFPISNYPIFGSTEDCRHLNHPKIRGTS